MLRKAAEKNPIRVVDDQVLTLLSRETWGMPSVCFVRTDNYGIYHVSAEGQCSWYEFARKIFELKGLRVDLKPVSTAEFPSPVRRPAYSVLSKKRLRSIGIEMPSWEEGLGQYLTARKSKTQTIKAASL
jgi:dTDP-4-dehydrorhamnose reductase